MMTNRLFLVSLAICLCACGKKTGGTETHGVQADSAMVVSAHPLASKIGASILKAGGNAVDASIATQFALAVVYPSAGNIGGGGFMVLRMQDGTSTALDFRETAPFTANSTIYLDSIGEIKKGLSEAGHFSCGVPGTVAGLAEAHTKYGKLPWKDLIQPAIDLATNGFALTEKEASGLNAIQADLKKYNTTSPAHLLKEKWATGDSIFHNELAHTLQTISEEGAKGFYEGEIANLIVAEMIRGKGMITADDLKKYKPLWRKPLVSSYKNYKIISMPPPSSGGIALTQLLKSIEPYAVEEWGWNTVQTIHLMTEAERRAYADRSVYLGDPDFYKTPEDVLTSDLYVLERMSTFNPEKATPSSIIKEGDIRNEKESKETTHLSIIDTEGNAVSVTTTLNGRYGSRVVVAGAGFLLNNEMDDFSVKPGVPNMYGAIGGEANKIEPGKRMLSSMTPTIIEHDGKLFMVVGSPGGTTIITSVFQTILNVVEHKMNMQEAVTAKRFHSQWLPDNIQMEMGAFDEQTIASLQQMGHTLVPVKELGRVDAILVMPSGMLEGGADPRGDDTAIGF
jgi:gamma-glutamyltranspeptidase/glutathione hydrolase